MSRPTLEEFNAAVPAFRVESNFLMDQHEPAFGGIDAAVAAYPNEPWFEATISPVASSEMASGSRKRKSDTRKARNDRVQVKRRRCRGTKKNYWSKEEDELLQKLVKQLPKQEPQEATGTKTEAIEWKKIAAEFPERTGKQCRERWKASLRPGIKRGEWTQEEDNLIDFMRNQFGNSWSKIAKELPHRTEAAIKNRYHSRKRTEDRNRFLAMQEKIAAEKKKNELNDHALQQQYYPSTSDLLEPDEAVPLELKTTLSSCSYLSYDPEEMLSLDTHSNFLISKCNEISLEDLLDQTPTSVDTFSSPTIDKYHPCTPIHAMMISSTNTKKHPSFKSPSVEKHNVNTQQCHQQPAPASLDKQSFLPSFAGLRDDQSKTTEREMHDDAQQGGHERHFFGPYPPPSPYVSFPAPIYRPPYNGSPYHYQGNSFADPGRGPVVPGQVSSHLHIFRTNNPSMFSDQHVPPQPHQPEYRSGTIRYGWPSKKRQTGFIKLPQFVTMSNDSTFLVRSPLITSKEDCTATDGNDELVTATLAAPSSSSPQLHSVSTSSAEGVDNRNDKRINSEDDKPKTKEGKSARQHRMQALLPSSPASLTPTQQVAV